MGVGCRTAGPRTSVSGQGQGRDRHGPAFNPVGRPRRRRRSQPKKAGAAGRPERVEGKEGKRGQEADGSGSGLPVDALADEVAQVGGVRVFHHGELRSMLAKARQMCGRCGWRLT